MTGQRRLTACMAIVAYYALSQIHKLRAFVGLYLSNRVSAFVIYCIYLYIY